MMREFQVEKDEKNVVVCSSGNVKFLFLVHKADLFQKAQHDEHFMLYMNERKVFR